MVNFSFKSFLQFQVILATFRQNTMKTLCCNSQLLHNVQIPQRWVYFNVEFTRKNPLQAMGFELTTIQRTSSCQCITFFWHHTNLMPIQESLTRIENRKEFFLFKQSFLKMIFFLQLEKKKNNKFPIFQFIRLFIFIFSLLLNKVAAESYRSFLTVWKFVCKY